MKIKNFTIAILVVTVLSNAAVLKSNKAIAVGNNSGYSYNISLNRQDPDPWEPSIYWTNPGTTKKPNNPYKTYKPKKTVSIK